VQFPNLEFVSYNSHNQDVNVCDIKFPICIDWMSCILIIAELVKTILASITALESKVQGG